MQISSEITFWKLNACSGTMKKWGYSILQVEKLKNNIYSPKLVKYVP